MASIVEPAAVSAEPSLLTADLTPSDRLLARSGGVHAGHFRAAPERSEFAAGGPLSVWYLVFPRNFTEIVHEGGRRVVGNPAQLMLYNPGDSYRRRPISAEGDHSDYLALDAAGMQALLDGSPAACLLEPPNPRFQRRTAPVSASLLARQRQLFARLEQHGGEALEAEEALLWLSAAALTEAVARAPATRRRGGVQLRQRETVEAAKRLLIERLEQPPTLVELGAQLHHSPFHLARMFLRQTGYTLHGFVQQQRLRLGFDRLVEQGRRIADIAADLGFAHHSHFTTQFGRAFGCTPQQARRQWRSPLQAIIAP